MRGEAGLLWKWEASTSSIVSSCLESDTRNLVQSADQPPKHCRVSPLEDAQASQGSCAGLTRKKCGYKCREERDNVGSDSEERTLWL